MNRIHLTLNNLFLFFLILLPAYLFGQSTGSISGKITDQKTGEPLIGVTILLNGTTQGAISDIQGNYLIQNVAVGTHSLTFKFLGYQNKTVTGMEVTPGKNTGLSTVMSESASKQLNEVVVTSSYNQASINALYAQRKKSSVISDGISADLIKKSPDKNTGEVLRRISGTSIQDQKFVVIRGLASRYNATLMNDAVMPSTEPDKKAFSFNIIPANLIDHIIISKTGSPDLPGNTAGGAIRINTKDFPRQKFMTLSVGTGYNTQTTFKPFYSGHVQGKYDFLGFDDGSRSLPDVFKDVQQNYARLSTEKKLAITWQFPNTFGGMSDGNSMPPLSLKFSAGNTKIYDNGNKLGYIAALNYTASRNALFSKRGQYLISKEQLYTYNDGRYIKNYSEGMLLNFAYTFGKNKISLKNFFSNEFENSFTKRTGKIFDGSNNVSDIFSINNAIEQNGLFNTVLEGKHQLQWNKLNISWALSYGLSYRDQPDQRILSIYQIDAGEPYFLYLSNENSPAITDAGRVYSRLHENIYSSNIHLALPFTLFNKEQKLKLGIGKVYRNRSFQVQALGYASALDPYGRGATIAIGKDVTLSNIFSKDHLGQYKILLANIPQNTKDYTGTANLNAFYLMLDNHLAPQWRLVWGTRVEGHWQQLVSINQPVQDYHNTDILPSANLTWSVSPKTNLRLAYSRTVNRPQFRELAAFRYYDYENDFIISGNPNLQRSTNDNIDFRVSYYPSASEVFSFSAFYKKFNHPIEQTNQGNNVLTYNNADRALDYGIEVEVRKRLGFNGKSNILHNVIFSANASFIRGSVTFDGKSKDRPLQGQSPYLINGGLSYVPANKDFSISVLYNRIGPRLQFRGENNGLDTYEKPRDLLDFQLSKKLFHRAVEIRLTVSDILSQPKIFYYKYGNTDKTSYDPDHDKIISSITPGTVFSLTFKYNFFNKK